MISLVNATIHDGKNAVNHPQQGFISDLGKKTIVQITALCIECPDDVNTSPILDGTCFVVMVVVADLSLQTIPLEEPIQQ